MTEADTTIPLPDALVDIQAIIFAECERNNGGCACKVQSVNLAAVGFGAKSRGARCDERYSIALAVLCAIAKANTAAIAPVSADPAGAAGLAELSQKATQGLVESQGFCEEYPGEGVCIVSSELHGLIGGASLLPTEYPFNGHEADPTRAEANADFIVALWNAYRSGQLVAASPKPPASAGGDLAEVERLVQELTGYVRFDVTEEYEALMQAIRTLAHRSGEREAALNVEQVAAAMFAADTSDGTPTWTEWLAYTSDKRSLQDNVEQYRHRASRFIRALKPQPPAPADPVRTGDVEFTPEVREILAVAQKYASRLGLQFEIDADKVKAFEARSLPADTPAEGQADAGERK